MPDDALTEKQREMAKRAGRVAGIMAISKLVPGALHRFPVWAQNCFANLAEAGAMGAKDAVKDLNSPAGFGFTLGATATLRSWIHRPDEGWGASVIECLNIYSASCTETIKQETGQDMPSNQWDDFARMIFTAYLTYEYDGRREFIRGMEIALDAEKNYSNGELRETTATPVYAELLLFLPEVSAMKSLGEVYRFLEGRFSDSPAVLGDFERFRKAANRIELSFKDQTS